ncbi:MAG: MOSC domain-containing protein [Gammaproteobacteria bacterium]|nr:MOSC domain-containing protein [Gammaproteobacteria bacterium]
MKVSGLSIHPVKSLGAITLKHAQIDHFGLAGDRRWMVIDEAGVMRTQRQLPRMTMVKTELMADGLKISAPDSKSIKISYPKDSERSLVKVWNDQCAAIDGGDEAAEWLSQFLGEPSRLVYFPENELRQVDPNFANVGERTAFSDGFPILLISQPSLDDLNARLESPVTMQRFRPNLVIDGCEPFAEDGWQKIRIGDITLRIVKPCSRCVIPTIDLDTGMKGAEPIKTLASYRMRENRIYFGQNVIAEGCGQIEVGMAVEILG